MTHTITAQKAHFARALADALFASQRTNAPAVHDDYRVRLGKARDAGDARYAMALNTTGDHEAASRAYTQAVDKAVARRAA